MRAFNLDEGLNDLGIHIIVQDKITSEVDGNK